MDNQQYSVFEVAAQWIKSCLLEGPTCRYQTRTLALPDFFVVVVGCSCVVISLSLLLNVCMVILVPSQIFIYHDSYVPG